MSTTHARSAFFSRLGSPWLLGALLLAAASTTGCTTQPLVLRTDVRAIVPTGRLAGTSVAILAVQDVRRNREVGRHRDGVLRVEAREFTTSGDVRLTVHRLFEITILMNGGKLAPPGQADLQLQIGLEVLDVTTDGEMAGEETFGNVQIAMMVTDRGGRQLGQQRFRRSFSDDEWQDAGMLGDGIRDAVLQAVGALPVVPQSPLPQLPGPNVPPTPGPQPGIPGLPTLPGLPAMPGFPAPAPAPAPAPQ